MVSDHDAPSGWVAAGRLSARFPVATTALGLAHAHSNPAVEVAAVRRELVEALGLGGKRPDLVFRLGIGHAMPMPLRRPVEVVLEPG